MVFVHLKMTVFNLLLVIWLFFLQYTNTTPQDECYYSNLKTGESWKMVWQDEFESDRLSIRNWKIEHENRNDECKHHYVTQTNCNRQENIWTNNGLLMMMAKQEKYADRNFTGAFINTEQFFTYGRYEIRAMVPLEMHIISMFWTHNENDQYWTESGQIDIVEIVSDNTVNHRGFYPYGRKSLSQFMKSYLTLKKHNNSFHRYGVEWDAGKIKFFFDDNYGETILLNDTFQVKPWKQLRIQIYVLNEANNMPKMDWKCPAILVDYVRVYKKVQLKDLNEKEIKSKQCADKSDLELQEQEIVAKKICAEASVGNRFKSESKHSKQSSTEHFVQHNNYWVYATISLLMIVIFILIVLVVYQFCVSRNDAKKSATPAPQNELELHEYTEIHDNRIY